MSEDNVQLGFARRYRPSTLGGYIGNEKIRETVENMLQEGKRRVQAILLTGFTGCGKTTLARILTKEYLCPNRSFDGACGKCETCEQINEYIATGDTSFLEDVKEVDITDKSGKSSIDEVLETVDYPSLSGGWKVYIFDEVHMATVQAQNRLLKVIEDPPEKVLFIFCTTNPEKMLDTLKNRCNLKLSVAKPNLQTLMGHLGGICKQEGLAWDNAGLRTIATRADFIVRDSLNLLEQVASSRGKVTGKDVAAEFDEVGEEILYSFIQCYRRGDYVKYLGLLQQIKDKMPLGMFLNDLKNFVTRGIYVANDVTVQGLGTEEIETYGRLFKQFSPHELAELLKTISTTGVAGIEFQLMEAIFARYRELEEAKETHRDGIGSVEIIEPHVSDGKNVRADNVSMRKAEGKQEAINELHNLSQTVDDGDILSMFGATKVE